MPSASARRNVRRFFANERMLIIPAEEVREVALQPYPLRRGRIRAKERSQDIIEPFGVDAADHAAGVGNGYGAALF